MLLLQELMLRLNCFVLRPAAVPIRLLDPDDDEIAEDVDPDELMRTLAPKKMVAPRFRWRRSRWMRNCPVALAEGNIVPGKPEFAVRFVHTFYQFVSLCSTVRFLAGLWFMIYGLYVIECFCMVRFQIRLTPMLSDIIKRIVGYKKTERGSNRTNNIDGAEAQFGCPTMQSSN